MSRNAIQQQFDAALDELVATLRQDRSVLAAVLCGSLSHDAVWSKSDIDLVLVTMTTRRSMLQASRSTSTASTFMQC